MGHLNPSHWPIVVACALLAIAALMNSRSAIVPNRLTLSAILAGWLMACVIAAAKWPTARESTVAASLGATVVGLLLLLPLYRSCGLGAGCVKMQMAFGAWIGCALDVPTAVLATAFATGMGLLLTAVGALWAAVRLRSDSVRSIGDSPAVDVLFPAQATLSMGSICGILTSAVVGWL